MMAHIHARDGLVDLHESHSQIFAAGVLQRWVHDVLFHHRPVFSFHAVAAGEVVAAIWAAVWVLLEGGAGAAYVGGGFVDSRGERGGSEVGARIDRASA